MTTTTTTAAEAAEAQECPHCKTELHPDATVCKACGATKKTNSTMRSMVASFACLIGTVLFLAALVFAVILAYQRDWKHAAFNAASAVVLWLLVRLSLTALSRGWCGEDRIYWIR